AALCHQRGVALTDAHGLEGDAELLGDDLRIGGLVALAVRLVADDDRDRAVGLDANDGGRRRPTATGLDVVGEADAARLAAALRLAPAGFEAVPIAILDGL